MIVICTTCLTVKSGIFGPISHGICFPCAFLFYGYYVRALMKPVASRSECHGCTNAEYDSDGVAESCRLPINEPCVLPDRRNPWGYR